MAIGGVSSPDDDRVFDRFVLDLSGAGRPLICFLPTASGDASTYIDAFYERFPKSICSPTHLSFDQRTRRIDRPQLVDQHVIYVGGGSLQNLLTTWRLHGMEDELRTAWKGGSVLCGVSAGAMCWFQSGVSFDRDTGSMIPIDNCLGLLDGSNCAHYDSDTRRRSAYHRLVEAGTLPAGFAIDDGAALHFHGSTLVGAFAARPSAAAWRVEGNADGVLEERLPASIIG